MDILSYILAHAGDIFGIIAAIHAVAVLIVNLTPSTTDNEILAKVYPYIEKLAGLFTQTSHEPGSKFYESMGIDPKTLK